MKKNREKKLFWAIITAIILLSSISLADSSEPQASQAAPTLKQEVVKLKYLKAEAVKELLLPYHSQYTRVSMDPKSNILTLRDTPENLDKMLAAIRKIDARPKDLLFTIQLLVASGSEENTDPELKNDPLIKEFQKLLRYKSYQLLDSALVRSLDGEYSQISFGPNNQFTLYLKPKVLEETPQANINLAVDLRQIKIQEVLPNNQVGWINISNSPISLINSQLNLKSGDRAVVGISRLEQHSASKADNKGLILIITGKILE